MITYIMLTLLVNTMSWEKQRSPWETASIDGSYFWPIDLCGISHSYQENDLFSVLK